MDDLDRSVRRALTESRLELSLEFHRDADGRKSGSIRVKDAAGRTVAHVELDSPEAMNVALARLVQLGFAGDVASRAAPAAPAEASSAREVETPVLVAGVDGYRRGWVAVSLDPSGDVRVSTHATFTEVLSLQARVIAVDIPIDPAGRGARPADAGARAFVGAR